MDNRLAALVHGLLIVLGSDYSRSKIQSFSWKFRLILVSAFVLRDAIVEGQRGFTSSLFIRVFILVFNQLVEKGFPGNRVA